MTYNIINEAICQEYGIELTKKQSGYTAMKTALKTSTLI